MRAADIYVEENQFIYYAISSLFREGNPVDVLSVAEQLKKEQDYIIEENKKAHMSVTTPQCRIKCSACGANKLNGGKCDARS